MHNDTHPQAVFSSYVATLCMDIAPKMCVGGGTLPFVFHVYVIRKNCMVSVSVGIEENYKKASHLSFWSKLVSKATAMKRKCNENTLQDVKKSVDLNRPTQKDNEQFSQSDVASNFDIASTKIHVERFIGWERDLSTVWPIQRMGLLSLTWQVICHLVNLAKSLISPKDNT